MVKVTEAEDLCTSWLIETNRTTESGSSLVPLMPAAQINPHFPPAPTRNPENLGNISTVLANHETVAIDDSMFYFTFGVQPQNLHPNSVHQDRERILQGSLKEDHEARLRQSRVVAALEILVAFNEQLVAQQIAP